MTETGIFSEVESSIQLYNIQEWLHYLSYHWCQKNANATQQMLHILPVLNKIKTAKRCKSTHLQLQRKGPSCGKNNLINLRKERPGTSEYSGYAIDDNKNIIEARPHSLGFSLIKPPTMHVHPSLKGVANPIIFTCVMILLWRNTVRD